SSSQPMLKIALPGLPTTGPQPVSSALTQVPVVAAASRSLIATRQPPTQIRLFDGATGAPTITIEARLQPSAIALPGDGRRVLGVGADRTWRMWDAANGQLLVSVASNEAVTAVAPVFTHDDRWLVSGVSAVQVTIRDGRTLQIARTISNTGRTIAALAIS